MSANHTEKTCIRKLNEKRFSERNSMITDLLQNKHFKPIRHLFYAVLFGFICNEIINVIIINKSANFGLRLIKLGFGKFHLVVLCWCLQVCINIITYFLFLIWAKGTIIMMPKSLTRSVWDYLFLSLFILYYMLGLYLVPKVRDVLDFPILSTAILTVEQIRLTMKSHAFVRTNAPLVIKHKPHTENILDLPKLSYYMYFLFVPTLIYRKQYPRTNMVDKRLVVKNFCEVFVLIWLMSFTFEHFFIRKFENTGKLEINWKSVVGATMENSMPGLLILVCSFYLLLHSWLNAFAEILRFADRKFYEDWWSATNFSIFFRTWNIVVQDWLYNYVYKDFYEVITPNSTAISKFMVLLISAVVHEYVLTVVFKLFFPLLFIMFFGAGMVLTLIETKHPVYNVFFWYSLALGTSLLLNLYTMEYFARSNCPVMRRNVTMSHLIPRILTMGDCLHQ